MAGKGCKSNILVEPCLSAISDLYSDAGLLQHADEKIFFFSRNVSLQVKAEKEEEEEAGVSHTVSLHSAGIKE